MIRKLTCILLLLLTLWGCSSQPQAYPFPNRDTRIISIELLYNEYGHHVHTDELRHVKELSSSEIAAFMDSIHGLSTERVGTPPPTYSGPYVAKVTYIDGTVELFGSFNIQLITDSTIQNGIGEYCFADTSFDSMWLEFAGDTFAVD